MSSSSPPTAVAPDQTNGRGEIQQRRTHGDGKDPTVGINEATGAPDTTASSAPVGSNFGPSTSLPKSSNMPIHYQQQQHQQQHQYPVQQYQTHHGTPPLGPHHVIRTVYEDSSQHQEQQRLLLFQHQQQQAILQSNTGDSRSKHGHRRHRKSLSSNAALSNGRGGAGGYGAFWGPQPSQPNHNIHAAPLAPLTAGPPRHKRHGSWGHQLPAGTSLHPPPSPASAASSPKLQLGKSLDPRVNELRSLTASLGMSPRSSPKPSPVMYAASSNTVMLETHHRGPPKQLQPFLLPPAAAAAASSWDSNDTFDYQYGAPDSMGMTRRYSNNLGPKRKESTRRKHMRQQSAQLYMESCRGVQQPLKCRNVFFLLLFMLQLIVVVYLGNMYFDYALFTRHHGAGVIQSYNRKHDHHHHGAVKTARISKDDDDRREDDVTDSLVIHYDNLLYIASLCGAFAMSLSAVSLGIMTLFARHVVQVALVMVITLSFVWGTIGIGLSPHNFVPITGIIALALSVAYAFIVWDRIPFATANVLTALTAVRTYPTLTVLALMFQSLALAWSIYFCVVTIGVYDAIQENKLVLTRNWAIALYTALGVSYYWTFQVLSNILKACTASVIGSWWHNEIEPGVVSKAVFKTVFYSMGSICYGSLFVEPVNFLRQLAIIFRPSTTEDATLLCFHECLRLLANCITSMVDMLTLRFNHWAFTYIGMYNYSFSEAAHRAHELFEKRGWSLIVSDDLVPNLLLMTSLVLGGLTGCFAGLLEWVDVLQISSLNEPGLVSFVLGTVIGIVLSNILFGVIHSSVNTVIVCFAAEPLDFQQNHPQLSDEMREAWREVWPGALDAVDMRMAMAQARSSPVPSRKMPPGESLTPPLLV